jgi:hypothetical protein
MSTMSSTMISAAPTGPSGITLLLRDPKETARRCLEEEGLKPLTIAALGALAVGAAVFGAVVGSFRGGEQIAYGAIKVPLAMLGALVLCVPAFHAIAASLGRPYPLRTVVALTIAAAGRASLVLLAFAPVLWLAYDLGLGYHAAALAAALAYAFSGLAALGVLLRGLGEGRHRITTAIAFIAVFLAAGGQTSWILRPYLVRPQSEDVPFLRSVEGGFADALYRSSRSAVGLYDRAEEQWVGSQRAMESGRYAADAYDYGEPIGSMEESQAVEAPLYDPRVPGTIEIDMRDQARRDDPWEAPEESEY